MISEQKICPICESMVIHKNSREYCPQCNAEIINCKDCFLAFLLTEKDLNWFKKRKLQNPVRCPTCRDKRKTAKVERRIHEDFQRVLRSKGGSLRFVHCKSCSLTFSLTSKEVRWYEDRNMYLPSHCPSCREWNRVKNNQLRSIWGNRLIQVLHKHPNLN